MESRRRFQGGKAGQRLLSVVALRLSRIAFCLRIGGIALGRVSFGLGIGGIVFGGVGLGLGIGGIVFGGIGLGLSRVSFGLGRVAFLLGIGGGLLRVSESALQVINLRQIVGVTPAAARRSAHQNEAKKNGSQEARSHVYPSS